MSTVNVPKRKGFTGFFPNADEITLDFLRKLLVFNPTQRMTVEEALNHKYVKEFHNPKEEIIMDHAIIIHMDDNKKFSIRDYREAIYEDIIKR